jgi:hypothetical protein
MLADELDCVVGVDTHLDEPVGFRNSVRARRTTSALGLVNGDGPDALFSVEYDNSGGHYYVSSEIVPPPPQPTSPRRWSRQASGSFCKR